MKRTADRQRAESKKIRDAMLRLLAERDGDKTICPSEVAREIDPADWRRLMPSIRSEAVAMAGRKEIEIRQKGEVVSPDGEIRGPIRIARKGNAEVP